MADQFDTFAPSLEGPAAGGYSIVPTDAVTLAATTRAIYVGVGGILRVEMKWGGEITFQNVPDGALLPIRAVRVLAATTASSIVGLY